MTVRAININVNRLADQILLYFFFDGNGFQMLRILAADTFTMCDASVVDVTACCLRIMESIQSTRDVTMSDDRLMTGISSV